MIKATVSALALAASLAIGGSAAATQPAPRCKVVSETVTTQTRVVIDETRSGDQTGTQSRTVTTTNERCRGKAQTETTYGPWSAPTFSY